MIMLSKTRMGILDGLNLCVSSKERSIASLRDKQFMKNVEKSSGVAKKYLPPTTRLVPLHLESGLCGSPLAGGSEDIGYEDWD